MSSDTYTNKNKLDPQWIELIRMARDIGIPIKDILEFLSRPNLR